MKRKHLAAFLVLLAAGCSQTPAPDAGSVGETTADPNLTMVTLNVEGMT